MSQFSVIFLVAEYEHVASVGTWGGVVVTVIVDSRGRFIGFAPRIRRAASTARNHYAHC